MTKNFTNFHNHTVYSLLDGHSKLDKYCEQAKKLGQLAVTVTDHGNVFGALDFYDAATAAGLKPFIGEEFYQARKTRFDRDGEERASGSSNEWGQKGPYHCGIIAVNNTGYQNLVKLSSRAFLEGYYVKPRVDHDLLEQHHEGLVMLSGCLSGEIQQALLRDDFQFALDTAAKMQAIFGKDKYFIEVQNHGIDEEIQNYPKLLEIASLINAPIIATCDSHYVSKDDAHAHDVMLCQPPGTKVQVVTTPSKKGLERTVSIKSQCETRNIEDIKIGDRVVSWNGDSRKGRLKRGGDLVSSIGSRSFKGNLIEVTLPDGSKSSYTPDHICVARLDGKSLRDKFIVYLMKKEDRYRIGSTGYVRNGNNLLGVAKRAKENGADAAWILGVFDSEREARMHEELSSFIFSIPTWTFKPSIERVNYFYPIWDFIGNNRAYAEKCLAHHGRDIRYPLWTKEKQLTQRRTEEIRACNLLDGMLVCQFSKVGLVGKSEFTTYEGSNSWQPITLNSIPYEGTVYSIDVENTHTYIADDIVTHNCVNVGSRLDNPDRFKFSGPEFYLKSYDEMTSMFPQEYVDNTMLIYDMHDLKLNFEEYHFPKFPLPKKMTDAQFFKQMCYEGAQRRFGNEWRSDQKVVDRLEYEMGVIIEMGFPNYFLVVADLVVWAKENDILVGLGRGSAAGSLASYCMRITEVNPLDYDLPFERFLVPGRKSMPDIDLDFDDRYRERVIEYARQKYGADHTAHICTYNKIGAKKAVRDAARVLGYEYDLGDKITKVMPPPVFGVAKSLTECLQTEEFKSIYDTDEQVKDIVDTAFGLEGLIRETSVHAAGLVIADRPIIDYVPVMQKGEGTPIITQYDMHRMEENGLLKIDFLGLRNLSIVDMCVKTVKKRHGIDLDPYQIPKMLDDKVFESLSRGENVGVFQVESPGIKDLLVGMKPSRVEDLVAILALYRPGPMGSNVHNEFVARKHGKKPIQYLHKSLEQPLANTFGLLLYQEQLLAIARTVAGFDVGEADDLRKVVGKKLVDKMPLFRAKFVEGCMKTVGMSKSVAESLFKEIEHHASYSFSSCHSVPYGLLSYITAYLRVNYPVEYMAAALSTVQDNEERLRLYLEGAKSLGLSVLPPSINYSEYNFSVKSDNEIVYGFSAISGIGEVIANKMIESRERPYTSIYDFMRNIDNEMLNKRVVTHFVAAGCFDELVRNEADEQPKLTREQKLEVLNAEVDELGIFLTDHPLSDLYNLIIDQITHTVVSLENASMNDLVKIGGVVVSFKKRMTKLGKKMYTMKIEDLTGNIEVSFFPSKAEQLEDTTFKQGDIVVIEGKLDRRSDDENSTISIKYLDHVLIDTVMLFGESPIFLDFDQKPYYQQIKKINEVIENNDGESTVFLSFYDGVKRVRMRFNKTTSPDVEDILKTLMEII